MGMRRTAGLLRMRIIGVLVFAVSPMFVATGVAQAQTAAPRMMHTFTAKSVSYKVSWTFKSRPLGKCVIFTAQGSIKYSFGVPSGERYWEWKNIKLTAPKITADIHTYGGGSCIGPATVNKLTMGQYWTGYSCGFNPSLSVSIPWGISFGGWPSCGNRHRAGFSTTYNTTSSVYTQNNSGSPTGFGNVASAVRSNHPCYGVFISAVAYVGSSSDSFGASSGSSSRRVCLTKT